MAACSQTIGPSKFQTLPATSNLSRGGGEVSSYRVLHNFRGDGDGVIPMATLINAHGTLYGTTSSGGVTPQCEYCGTVFRISTEGAERLLYSFGDLPDGEDPAASLIDVNGTLYGTTFAGGAGSCSGGCGTVFSVSAKGKERVLHSFGGAPDGVNPFQGLIDVNGTLYGTTDSGGTGECSGGCGTVFSISTTGKERVLYSFRGVHDGVSPFASLIDVHGTLYGTTVGGGTNDYGTVFRIGTNGEEHVLYSFGGSPDGQAPVASLVYVNGTLYGTTAAGGTSNYCGGGCGTVFSVSTKGEERVLHSFGGPPDGEDPEASLIDVNGTLYGTTLHGGTNGGTGGVGTIFSISTSGKERVLHSFGAGTDGQEPYSGLVDINGTLYGTTAYGGTWTGCPGFGSCGTVFALTP